MRQPILPDENREENQYYILGLDEVAPKEDGKFKPEQKKGHDHVFGLDARLLTSKADHKEARKDFVNRLGEKRKKRKEWKKEINELRTEIEKDKKAFLDSKGVQNPLTDMRMLKQALGIRPNELDNNPIGQEIVWVDPEEALADGDKFITQQGKDGARENIPDSEKFITETVTLFCPEKTRRDLEVRDILQKRKLAQSKIGLLK